MGPPVRGPVDFSLMSAINQGSIDQPLSSRRTPNLLRRCLRAMLGLLRRAHAAAVEVRLTPAREQRRSAIDALQASGRPVTLFVAPDAGIAPFYASHALLARVLRDAGHAALILSCDGMQPMCSVKFASHVPPTAPGDTQNAACTQCRTNMLVAGSGYGLIDLSLERILDVGARDEIARVIEANAATPWNTMYDDIAIGAACLGETLRDQRKISVDELTEKDRALLAALLYSSLAVYLAVKALATRFKIVRIVYFGDYAYYLAPQIFAKRHGIGLTHISHAYNCDIDRRRVVLWPGYAASHFAKQVERWDANRHAAITPPLVGEIAEGALFRLRGHGGASTYSPNWVADPGDLHRQLGLPPGGKVVAVYSNSTDELVCNREFARVLGAETEPAKNPFPSQIAWLRAMADWAARRDDVRLIIRLHPRMAVSHRHLTVASEYAQMQAALANLPANVAVIPPDSRLSSYNLAEIADIAVTAWSSIGLELARFGLPVVAAFQKVGPFPRSDFIGFEETAGGFFALVEQGLGRVPSLETIVGAFRWTHFLHWTSVIDVSDVVPEAGYPRVPRYRSPRHRDTMLRVLTEGADLVEVNMARLPKGTAASAAERAAVIAAIEKFVAFFMIGRPPNDGEAARPTLAVDPGDRVTLQLGNWAVTRNSRLVARLAKVLARASAETG